MIRTTVILVGGLAAPTLATSQAPPDFLGSAEPKASVMLLGTFHFRDAGLDDYKPQFDVDITSAVRQREVEELVTLLARYEPTKVALEVRRERQPALDSAYRAYLDGQFELSSRETHQLGFRLAAQLGHERVYAVDAPARGFYDEWSEAVWRSISDAIPQGRTSGIDWDERYTQLYRYGDSVKTQRTLREHLLWLNSEERIRQGHGHYLVGWREGDHGSEPYFDADAATRWYNRNLRIFHNILRIIDSPQERVLLVIGAGHLPILRHTVIHSPELQLVEVADFLAR